MATELIIIPGEYPLPEDLPKGRPRATAIRDALGMLTVGGQSIEVNRHRKAAEHYVYRHRVENGRDLGFKVRASKPGWSRIWRVK